MEPLASAFSCRFNNYFISTISHETGVIFFLQAQGSWNKYVNKETTVAFVSKVDPFLTFPTVVACSDDGIRRERMNRKLGLHENYWMLLKDKNTSASKIWKWPKDKNELDEWYNISTFSKQELISRIRQAIIFQLNIQCNTLNKKCFCLKVFC